MPTPGNPDLRAIAAYQKVVSRAQKSQDKPRPPSRLTPQPRPAAALPPGFAKVPAPSKIKRLAQFLVLVGSERAREILARLPPEQVEEVSREIARLTTITPFEKKAVLTEFTSLLSKPGALTGGSTGGVETARRILYAAFGPDSGEKLLQKVVPEAAVNPFDFLRDYSGEQIATLFHDESVAVQALVYSRLPPAICARALEHTPVERKAALIRRIARLEETAPEVIEQVAGALREKTRRINGERPTEIDGMGALAAILRNSDLSFGDRLLEELEDQSPTLGRGLRERLYTLDDVVQAEDIPLQNKLRSMNDREIALLLKGRSAAFTNKILGNLSTQRAQGVRDEGQILGPVPRIEVEAAARDFMAWFRKSLKQGRIMLATDKDVVL